MDILSDNNISNVDQSGPFSTVLHTVMGITRWLSEFFTLTEEDRLAAGIILGSDKQRNG